MSGFKRSFDSRKRGLNSSRLSSELQSILRTAGFDNYNNSLPDTFTDSNDRTLTEHNAFWRRPEMITGFTPDLLDTVVIDTNRLKKTGSGELFAYYKILPTDNNHYVETSAYVNVEDSGFFTTFARFRDSPNAVGSGPSYIGAQFSTDGTPSGTFVSIVIFDNGTVTPITTNYFVNSFAAGQTVKLGLMIIGNTYTAYLNGVPIKSITQANVSPGQPELFINYNGYVGIHSSGDNGSGAAFHIDSFYSTGIGLSGILTGLASVTIGHSADLTANQKPMTVKRTAVEISPDWFTEPFTYSTGELNSVSSGVWTKNTDITATPLANVTAADRVRSGAADSTTAIQAYRLSVPPPYRADYAVEADAYIAALPAGGSFGATISARQQAASTSRYRFVFNVTSTGAVNLYLYQTLTLIGTRSNYLTGVSAGQSYRMRLQVYGTAIKAYLDDIEIFSVTNATITGAGTAGVEFANSTGETPSDSNLVHLDDFRVSHSKGIATLVNAPKLITGTAAVTIGQSGSLTAKGILAGTAPVTIGASGSLTAKGNISGNAAVTIGASGSLAALVGISGNAAVNIGTKSYLLNKDDVNVLPDPFTASNGTLLQDYAPARWVKQSFSTADAVINSDQAYGEANYAYYYHTAALQSADYHVSLDGVVHESPVSPQHWTGVVGRYSIGTNTGYYAQISYQSGTNVIELWRTNNGAGTQLGSTVNVTVGVGEKFNLRLEMLGTSIKVFFNLEQVISVTDSNITAAGKAGMFFESQGVDSHYWHDNYHISNTVLASGLITGTAAVTIGASGDVVGIGNVSGSTGVNIAASGNVLGVGVIDGAAAVTIGASGNATALGIIEGTAPVVIGASGDVQGIGVIEGTAPVVIGASGDLSATGLLTGSADVSIGATGQLSGIASIDGAAAVTISASGDLSAVVPIDGAAAVTIGASGDLSATGVLAGSADVVIDAAGQLSGIALITGTATVTIGASGNLTAVSGNNIANVTIDAHGDLIGIGHLTGSAGVTISATGTLVDANAVTVVRRENVGNVGGGNGYYRPMKVAQRLREKAIPDTPISLGKTRIVGSTAIRARLTVEKKLSVVLRGSSSISVSKFGSVVPMRSRIVGNVDISAKLRLNYLTELTDDEIAAIYEIMSRRKRDVLVA